MPRFVITVLLLTLAGWCTELSAQSGFNDLFSDDRDIYGSEKEEKYPVNAYIFDYEKWEGHSSYRIFWIYKHKDYPKYKSTLFFPFYYHLQSKIDQRKKRVIFPGFALYRSVTDGNKKNAFLFPLVFWGKDKEQKSYYVNAAGLFHFQKDLNSRRNFIFPLYYYSRFTADSQSDRYFNFLLLFHSWSSERNGKKNHAGPLYYSFKNNDFYHRYAVNTFWGESPAGNYFHFAPVYFSRTSAAGSYKNIAGLIYHNSRNLRGKLFWLLFPVYFQKQTNDEDGSNKTNYKTALFLFHKYTANDLKVNAGPFYYFKKNGESGRTAWLLNSFWGRTEKSKWFHFAPLFFSYRSDARRFTNVAGILHWDRSETAVNRWLFPLYAYRNKKDGYRFLNIAGLYSSVKKEGSLDRLYILPVYLYKKDTYRHIFPLYFSGKSGNGEYSWLIPFYGRTRFQSPEGVPYLKENTFFTLLWYNRETKRDDAVGDSSTFSLFPLLPLYYTNTDRHRTHKNLFYLADWTRDGKGLKRFWLMPLAYYKRDSYFHLFPFYFRPTPASGESGVSFGPVHYHQWSPEKETIWSLLYFSKKDKLSGNFQKHFVPLYFSWKTDKSNGNIGLPLWINYEDETKQIHVNLSGFSTSRQQGTIQAGGGLSSDRKEFYLDVDIAWLYNMFRYSRRVTGSVPFFGNRKDAAADQVKNTDKTARNNIQIPAATGNKPIGNQPAIQKKSKFSRETARDFTGYSLLFGFWAYEKADTKRHLRVLPLSWLTWDETSDDKLFVIPLPVPVVWYKSENISYKVVFPFYGRQQENGSFVESWLLLGFIREYNAEKQKREYSVIWPLTNFYSSPEESGSRVLPFYIYKSVNKPDLKETKFYSLLYYASSSEKGNVTLKKQMFPLILPLVFSREKTVTGTDASTVKTSYVFPLWLKYFQETKSSSGTTSSTSRIYTLLHYKSVSRTGDIQTGKTIIYPLFFYKSETPTRKKWNWLFVFHGSSEKKVDEIHSSFKIFPLYFHKRIKNSNLDFKSNTVAFLYHHHTQKTAESDLSHTNLFWFIDYKKDKIKQTSSLFVFPVYFYNRYESSRSVRTSRKYFILLGHNTESRISEGAEVYRKKVTYGFPVFYYKRDYNISDAGSKTAGTTHLNMLGLFHLYRKSGVTKNIILFPVFYYGDAGRTKFIAGLYWRKTPDYKRINFLYLLDYKSSSYNRKKSFNLFLGTIHFETSPQKKAFTLFYGLAGNFEKGPSHYHYRLLWLGVHKDPASYTANFIPLFHYKRRGDQRRYIIPPALTYINRDQNRGLELGGLGLLWYRNYNKSTGKDTKKVLLGILYSEKHKKERGYSSYGSLGGLLWKYQKEEETGFSKIDILMLFGKSVKDGKTRYKVFGVKL